MTILGIDEQSDEFFQLKEDFVQLLTIE